MVSAAHADALAALDEEDAVRDALAESKLQAMDEAITAMEAEAPPVTDDQQILQQVDYPRSSTHHSLPTIPLPPNHHSSTSYITSRRSTLIHYIMPPQFSPPPLPSHTHPPLTTTLPSHTPPSPHHIPPPLTPLPHPPLHSRRSPTKKKVVWKRSSSWSERNLWRVSPPPTPSRRQRTQTTRPRGSNATRR